MRRAVLPGCSDKNGLWTCESLPNMHTGRWGFISTLLFLLLLPLHRIRLLYLLRPTFQQISEQPPQPMGGFLHIGAVVRCSLPIIIIILNDSLHNKIPKNINRPHDTIGVLLCDRTIARKTLNHQDAMFSDVWYSEVMFALFHQMLLIR